MNTARTALCVLVLGTSFLLAACEKDEPSQAQVCNAVCDEWESFAKDHFDALYDSEEDCEDDCVAGADDAKEEYSECEERIDEYLDCFSSLSADEVDDENFDACDEESDDLEDCMEEFYETAFDNSSDCQEAQDEMNSLECLTTDFDLSCDTFTAMDCDYAPYFECLPDVYGCDGDMLELDEDQLDECSDIAEDLADC